MTGSGFLATISPGRDSETYAVLRLANGATALLDGGDELHAVWFPEELFDRESAAAALADSGIVARGIERMADAPDDAFKAQLDTVSFEAEVMRTGEWNGIAWGEADLDMLVQNHEAKVADIPLRITQDGSHEGQSLVLPGGAALGWVESLKRVGARLIARFKDVPRKIYDLISSGALKKKSVEGWTNFQTADGQKHGRTLTGVLFFGGEGLPAVHGLDDLALLYELEPGPSVAFEFAYQCAEDGVTLVPAPGTGSQAECHDTKSHHPTPKSVALHTAKKGADRKVDITDTEYRELVEASARLKVATEQAAEADKKAGEIALKAKAASDEAVALKARAEKAEGELKAQREKVAQAQKAETAAFVHKLVEGGKIRKASEESVVEQILEVPEGAERIALCARLEKRESLFGESVSTPEKETKAKPEEGSMLAKQKALESEALAYQKANPGVDYESAFAIVSGGGEDDDG